MKNKNIKTMILLLMMALLSVGCSEDFLNTQPLDAFSEEGVWNNVDGADGFLYAAYNQVNDLYNQNDYAFNDGWTLNIANWSGGNNVANEQIDQFTDMGWNRYSQIRRANLVIQKVTESEGINEVDKNRLVAEAKFLRGMTYLWLAKRFGGVIIVDRPFEIDDDFKLPRATLKETYDFIIKDFSEVTTALAGIDLGKGRASEGAARAFIAEAALQAAAYTNDPAYYDQVIAEATIVDGLGYALDPDYGTLFRDPSYASASSEVIFGQDTPGEISNQLSTPVQFLIPNIRNDIFAAGVSPDLQGEFFAGWIERHPTQQLVDDYLVVDTDGVAKKWDETTAFTAYVPGTDYVSFMWKNRDQRFYSSIAYDSVPYSKQPVISLREGGNLSRLARGGDWGTALANYLFIKHLPDVVGNKGFTEPTPFFYIHQRLSRVYLNHAEALLGKGDVSGAIALINQTRATHGELPDLSSTLPLEEAWKYYKIERRVELLMENDYYWSVLRWGKYEGGGVIDELNEVPLGIEITADGKSYSFRPIDNNHDRNFTVRRYLFPVPEGERQLNDQLTQNPNW